MHASFNVTLWLKLSRDACSKWSVAVLVSSHNKLTLLYNLRASQLNRLQLIRNFLARARRQISPISSPITSSLRSLHWLKMLAPIIGGVSANANARLTRSLTALCLYSDNGRLYTANQAMDSLIDSTISKESMARPWVPAALIDLLAAHAYMRQMFEPRRSPTAILSEVLSRRVPTAELELRWRSRQHDVMTPQYFFNY